MSPKEYEAVVSGIVTGLRRNASELSGMTLSFGGANRLLGASGYAHQIDVSLVGTSHIYLIECKRWGEKVGVQEIMVLAARGSDVAQSHPASTVHCIMATTVGVTRGGVILAKHFNIEIEIVRSAQEFAMRIGKRVSVGMAGVFAFRDSFACTVVSNGAVAP